MISGMSRSPWEAERRKAEEDGMFASPQAQQNAFLGQILERSSSAPPLPSESKDDGFQVEENGYLFESVRRQRTSSSRLGLYDSGGRDTAPLSTTDTGAFYPVNDNEDTAGRSTAPGIFSAEAFDEPLFSGSRDQTASNEEHLGAFNFNRRVDEVGMVRSQSAAPTFLSRGSVGPPPGLGGGINSASSQELYRSETFNAAAVAPGMRRASSTGVIAGHSTSSSVLRSLGLEPDGSSDGGGAVRPAPKTLMDLIQEDYPASPSPMYNRGRPDDSYDSGYGNEYDARSHARTSTPPSQYAHTATAPRNFGGPVQQQDRVPHDQHQDSLGRVTHSMEHLQVSARHDYYQREQQHYAAQQRPEPMVREHYQEHPSQQPMYAPARQEPRSIPPHRPQMVQQPHPTHQQYESQPVYYTDRHQRRVAPQPTAVQAQILPSGHTVYVSAPPPYEYQTMQYHPGAAPPQQTRIVHQQPGGHEYISIVPVQTGAPMAAVAAVPSQGTYTYWHQQEVHSPTPVTSQPVTYINAHGAAPMARAPNSPMQQSPSSSRRHKAGAARSPNEKPGKGGRRGTRRGGGDPKHSPGGSAAHPRLDEFRATKNRDWTIMDISGHVVEFCQDQNGSRFIQQRLEVGDLTEKQIVITEVLPDVQRLRNDVFGNYVVQKLLEYGTPEMKADLRDTLQGEMLALSLQMYGCRVVQKALEVLSEDDLPHLLREFHHNVLSCIQDQNGNHVIQKCVEVTSNKAKMALSSGDEAKAHYFSEQIDFILNDVLENVGDLSCHPYGCRVLQRILEHCIEPKKTRTLDEISKCHRRLLDDQYGNYVIQHVLQYGRHSDRESILHIVVESGLLKLSKQKFASNVVEKLLKYGGSGQRNAIVREMLKVVDEETGAPVQGDAGGSTVVLLMVRDAYANYVVQTTLDVVPEGEEKRMLLEELNSHSAQLRNYTFAKHIVTKLGA